MQGDGRGFEGDVAYKIKKANSDLLMLYRVVVDRRREEDDEFGV